MKFDTPVTKNPIDRQAVIGQALDRIDGPLKTTGTAPYAYERHDVAPDAAYGFPILAPIGKGHLDGIDADAARKAPGVLAVVTATDAGKLGKGKFNTAPLLGGPDIAHYHQALGVVVAASFEQARVAAALVGIRCTPATGRFSLADAAASAPLAPSEHGSPSHTAIGDFEAAFAAAPVKLDARYTTPDQSHAMMEPHATTAAWDGDRLTVWTSNQMVDWGRSDLAKTLNIPKEKIRLVSPFVGGGFGSKLFLRADVILASLGARACGRPVKIALPRPAIFNNTTHRPATIQRIRIGAGTDGRITAIGHESWSGDQPGGAPETATAATRKLYAGPNRMTAMRLAVLDLPEGNAMRAPGEAPGLMALEIAMDEMAERLRMDPVQFRVVNDTQVVPEEPNRPFSRRHLVECLRTGAERFGWTNRDTVPGRRRDGDWLLGMGVASAFRDSLSRPSAARVRLERDGSAVVETDMTDIGTGSYTILAQTAAEMLGLPLHAVTV
ncbi:MAG: xanthine dehydrogenase family protein molybdopterin-binding subunit, partial [Gluconacetobacter diazotrophicus]|nr:xanthine dehydrogenase family protein molybdopterin-binding subunit [Gluconacetobacter diazotrophicus]